MAANVYGATDKLSLSGGSPTGPIDSSSSIVAGVVTLGYAATLSPDASQGCHFRVTLTGDATLGAPSNGTDGQKITFEFIQDSAGSRTVTYGTGIGFGGSVPEPTLTTTASKRDFLALLYNAGEGIWYAVGFVAGY